MKLLRCPNEPYCQGPLNLLPGWRVGQKIVQLENKGNHWEMAMGAHELMLNVITPLQKYTGGVTVSDVLWQRYLDLTQREISNQFLKSLETHFVKDRINMQQVSLMVEIFVPDGNSRMRFHASAVSNIITNSKSKEYGPLRLQDANPTISCSEGGARVYLLSHFKLMPSTKPWFVIWDPATKKIVQTERKDIIKQPTKSSVFNQFVIMFDTPAQDYELLNTHVYSKNYQIQVSAYRPNDHRLSSTSYEFRYVPHGFNGLPMAISTPEPPPCVLCMALRMKNDNPMDLPPARPNQFRRRESKYYKLDTKTDSIVESGNKTSSDGPKTDSTSRTNLGPGSSLLKASNLSLGPPPMIQIPFPKGTTITPIATNHVPKPTIIEVAEGCEKMIIVKKDPEDILEAPKAIQAPDDEDEGVLVIKEEPFEDCNVDPSPTMKSIGPITSTLTNHQPPD